jgi:hypothetical protein
LSLDIYLVDPASGKKLALSSDGAVPVVKHTHPPLNEGLAPEPFRQFFTDDGSDTGDEDMKVNASAAAPQDFTIAAKEDRDVFIKSISIVIADAGATLNQFGSIGALTNGVQFLWSTQSKGEVVLHPGMVSNFDFVQLALGDPAFGDGNGAFRANNVESTSEAFLPVIDLQRTFGFDYGLRLKKGTLDKIILRIQDNVSGVDRFDAVGFGMALNDD